MKLALLSIIFLPVTLSTYVDEYIATGPTDGITDPVITSDALQNYLDFMNPKILTTRAAKELKIGDDFSKYLDFYGKYGKVAPEKNLHDVGYGNNGNLLF